MVLKISYFFRMGKFNYLYSDESIIHRDEEIINLLCCADTFAFHRCTTNGPGKS